MLTRYKGPMKLEDWGGDRSAFNDAKARVALARRLAIFMHATLRHGTEFEVT